MANKGVGYLKVLLYHAGWESNNPIEIISEGLSKKKFAEVIADIDIDKLHTTRNWISQRISETGNNIQIALASRYKGKVVFHQQGNILKIVEPKKGVGYLKTCQMTISTPRFPGGSIYLTYFLCGKPAKFRNPKPQMNVEFVCGIHARSINKTYERIGSKLRCIPIPNKE